MIPPSTHCSSLTISGLFRSEISPPPLSIFPPQVFLHSKLKPCFQSQHHIRLWQGCCLGQNTQSGSCPTTQTRTKAEADSLLLCQLWEERQDLNGHKVCSYRVNLFLTKRSLYDLHIYMYMYVYVYMYVYIYLCVWPCFVWVFWCVILNTNLFHDLFFI